MESAKQAITDKNLIPVFDHIFQNAIGNVIIAEATPTNATMKANTLIYYNNELFFKFANGLSFKITLTAVA